jgi:hypothetical protein
MAAHFAELTINRSSHTSLESIGMEEEQGNYSHLEKSRGVDVHLVMEGTNSNGHGEERNEDMNMAETINNLQKDVQSHKVDNERLMKSKEKKDDFNMKLLEGLNRIEKKLVKESGSSEYGSHKPSEEKRKVKSASRNHHHSQRHSHKRAGNSSSISLFIRYKRSGVDEL